MLAESVSSVLSSFKSEMQFNDGVFKENVKWRNNMSFKKDAEKIVLLKVKCLIHIVKFRTKKNCTFLSSATSHPYYH